MGDDSSVVPTVKPAAPHQWSHQQIIWMVLNLQKPASFPNLEITEGCRQGDAWDCAPDAPVSNTTIYATRESSCPVTAGFVPGMCRRESPSGWREPWRIGEYNRWIRIEVWCQSDKVPDNGDANEGDLSHDYATYELIANQRMPA